MSKKLLIDEMLKNLVSWLRIFGVDTIDLPSRLDDNFLIERAQKEGRVLVTRDLLLTKRCKNLGIESLLLGSETQEKYLQQIVEKLSLELPFPEVSRCTGCNTVVNEVSAEEATPYVPEKILEFHQQFWQCPSCQKTYWQGTHWPNILSMFEKINSGKKIKDGATQ